MIFITGPLYSGKHTFAKTLPGRCICDVQELAAGPENLEKLADELSAYDIVLATEVGGGVVPMDPAERAGRETAGRLACLLAARADCVVQMFCGIPTVLKGELPHADLFPAPRPDRIQRREALSGPAGHPAFCRWPRRCCARQTSSLKPCTITPLCRTRQTAECCFPLQSWWWWTA